MNALGFETRPEHLLGFQSMLILARCSCEKLARPWVGPMVVVEVLYDCRVAISFTRSVGNYGSVVRLRGSHSIH